MYLGKGGCFAGHHLQRVLTLVVVERETGVEKQEKKRRQDTNDVFSSVRHHKKRKSIAQYTESAALGFRVLVHLRPHRMHARRGKSTLAGTASGRVEGHTHALWASAAALGMASVEENRPLVPRAQS